MSGIAGILSFRPYRDDSARELVEKMIGIQLHRGPGSHGVIASGRASFGATCRRGVSPHSSADQPFRSEDGKRWIVFDGVLHSRAEIRKELLAKGRRFQSDSDAETALQAFEEWGEASLHRFVGPFAFAFHDEETGRSVLVRDHFGQKPLQYAIREGRLLFASEIKPLLAAAPSEAPNERALVEWFLYGQILEPATPFLGIHSLPPGHLLEAAVEVPEGTVRRYYSPLDQADQATYEALARLSPGEFLDELHAAIRKGVALAMEGGEPIGVMLSGGLDSSFLTAVSNEAGKVTAINASIGDDPRADERPRAEAVARHLGVPLIHCTVTEEIFLRELARVTYLNEMPLWHTQFVAFHLLAGKARAEGLDVLLCGTSLDTMLSLEPGRHLFQRILKPSRRLLGILPEPTLGFVQKWALSLQEAPVTASGFVHRLVPGISFIDGWNRDKVYRESEEKCAFIEDDATRLMVSTRLADVPLWFGRFFHRADRLTAGASVDHRNPFHDPESIRLAVNIPPAFLFRRRSPRWALQQLALRYLPRTFVFRPRNPWGLPAERYLARVATPAFFRDGFCSRFFRLGPEAADRIAGLRETDAVTCFSLVAVEVWGRLFFLHQTVEEITERILGAERS